MFLTFWRPLHAFYHFCGTVAIYLWVYAVFYSAFFSPFLFPFCSLPTPSFPGQISLVRCVLMKRPSWHMCHVTTTLSQANRRWAQTNRSEQSFHFTTQSTHNCQSDVQIPVLKKNIDVMLSLIQTVQLMWTVMVAMSVSDDVIKTNISL